MKKGFTLIELLAVIVILAIIALIAVPIVLGIIEDSKKSSKEESIKMYAKAVEQGVATIIGKNNAPNTTIGTNEKTLKSRLPGEDEVTSEDAGCHVYSSSADWGTCNYWMLKNLYYDINYSGYCSICVSKYSDNQNNGITNINHYWLLSSTPGESNSARIVRNDGIVSGNFSSNAGCDGVRPVITIPLSDLLS